MKSRLRRVLVAVIAAAAGFGSAGAPVPAGQSGAGPDHVAVKCYDWCGSSQR
ncbi:MAG TPA: hypothetical protein VGX25_11235 [Actinophytocola sp.]|uniref:hypothetical protein n=1 Tax=Actinophytocola sp. TaxID=1872138 RepID=UPI002DDD33D6|nr:hypothetical protein [Actinophytocola sp.]HEV2779959.1 hypothetical protein [Actinophytocola sp.]